jgi:hypothetical protein
MSCVENTMSDSVIHEQKKRKHEGTAGRRTEGTAGRRTKKPYRQHFMTLDLAVLAEKAKETWPAKEPGTKESGNKNPHTEQIDDQELNEKIWEEIIGILRDEL